LRWFLYGLLGLLYFFLNLRRNFDLFDNGGGLRYFCSWL